MKRYRHRLAWLVAVLVSLAFAQAAPAEDFRFTATSDYHSPRAEPNRSERAVFGKIKELVGGPGAFHVSVGDMGGAAAYPLVQEAFGKGFAWYPVVGNHDGAGQRDINPERLETLRQFYRDHLEGKVNAGPPNGVETTYSWDHGNAHFVALNLYHSGKSDMGGKGDVPQALYEWLEADLRRNTRPFVFVFGHEPAYPQGRHVGDSLDGFPENRDRFWALLEKHRVAAYISGHTHNPGAMRPEGSMVWQVNTGGHGLSFLDVTVGRHEVRFRLYECRRADGKLASDGTFAVTREWTVPSGRMAATGPASQPASAPAMKPLASPEPSAAPAAMSAGVPPVADTSGGP